jgi:two-component system, LytTR family, response regulator
MSLNTVIVEDEPLSRIFLHNLLTEFCEDIHVVATVPTEEDAVQTITRLRPDLVFMDIELQQGTGFEVLRRIEGAYPHVIFTTAFDHHAIRAIKFSGMEYLQKPIDIESLQKAIEGLDSRINSDDAQIALTHLLHTIQNNYVPTHLSLRTIEGMKHIRISELVRVEAGDAHCDFILDAAIIKNVGGNLKEYELMLSDHGFFRVHQGHLINTNKILHESSAIDNHIRMSDQSCVPVSSKKKDDLRKFM